MEVYVYYISLFIRDSFDNVSRWLTKDLLVVSVIFGVITLLCVCLQVLYLSIRYGLRKMKKRYCRVSNARESNHEHVLSNHVLTHTDGIRKQGNDHARNIYENHPEVHVQDIRDHNTSGDSDSSCDTEQGVNDMYTISGTEPTGDDDSSVAHENDDSSVDHENDDSSVAHENDDYSVALENDASSGTHENDDSSVTHENDDFSVAHENDDASVAHENDDSEKHDQHEQMNSKIVHYRNKSRKHKEGGATEITHITDHAHYVEDHVVHDEQDHVVYDVNDSKLKKHNVSTTKISSNPAGMPKVCAGDDTSRNDDGRPVKTCIPRCISRDTTIINGRRGHTSAIPDTRTEKVKHIASESALESSEMNGDVVGKKQHSVKPSDCVEASVTVVDSNANVASGIPKYKCVGNKSPRQQKPIEIKISSGIPKPKIISGKITKHQ